MQSRKLLFLNGAVLTVCAFFDFVYQGVLLIVFLYFLPFLDRQWVLRRFTEINTHVSFLLLLVFFIFLLLFLNDDFEVILLNIVFFIALPEEWFFRFYFLQRLALFCRKKWVANVVCSLFFSALHVPEQGWMGAFVFIPSLLFGWLYQRYSDLILVVLLHALFNGIYVLYLQDYFQ